MKTQALKNKDKLPQCTDENFSSQKSRFFLPLSDTNLFHSTFDEVHEHSDAVPHIAQ